MAAPTCCPVTQNGTRRYKFNRKGYQAWLCAQRHMAREACQARDARLPETFAVPVIPSRREPSGFAELHIHREIIGKFLAEALEIFGFGYGAIESRGGIDASNSAGIGAIGERHDFCADERALLNILQVPIAHKDARLHGGAIHDLGKFIASCQK